MVEFNGGLLWRKWEVEGRRIRVGRDLGKNLGFWGFYFEWVKKKIGETQLKK